MVDQWDKAVVLASAGAELVRCCCPDCVGGDGEYALSWKGREFVGGFDDVVAGAYLEYMKWIM